MIKQITVWIAEKVGAVLLLPYVLWQRLVITVIRHARVKQPNRLGAFTIHQTKLPRYAAKISDPFNEPQKLATHEIEAKLTYLDIGARGTVIDAVQLNGDAFDQIVMCEGEEKEAERLRHEGFKVIDRFLSGTTSPATFYHLGENPGASSLLVPQGPFLKLYGGEDYFDWHGRYEEIPVETSTLDAELAALNVNQVDLMKLDVQGSEVAVLEGYSTSQPLFWVVETTMHPTYEQMPYGVDLIKEIYDRGYLIIGQHDQHYRDGVLIWCDSIFAPNWAVPKGRQLIHDRPAEWRTLMRTFAREHLMFHIESEIAQTAGFRD